MIIFLYGTDTYRLKQNLDKIVVEYKKKHEDGMAFYTLDPDAIGRGSDPVGAGVYDIANKFENIIKTVNFFSKKQLVVLKNAFCAGEELTGMIKKWDLGNDKDKIIIIAENGGEAEIKKKFPIRTTSGSNEAGKFFKLLAAKPNIVKEFSPLAGKQLENWIMKEAENKGVKIEATAVKKLMEYAGNNSWRLSAEIGKLANYAASSGAKQITEKDIELLVTPKINLNIFETIDAIGQKNRGKAVTLLNRHLSEGEDPFYLFSMFVYQFRNLLRVKSLAGSNGASVPTADAIVKKTGLHPFVAKKLLEQSRKFELSELKQKFIRLADYDVAVKNGEMEMVDCLYQIALG